MLGKCTQHNGQGKWKNVFSLTSEHKIINSHTRHESLSNDIPHQNTRFYWYLLKSSGNLTLHYVALHYTFHTTIENFSACCNTSRGIKLAASQASRLRSACSLAIISTYFPNLEFVSFKALLHCAIFPACSMSRDAISTNVLTLRNKLFYGGYTKQRFHDHMRLREHLNTLLPQTVAIQVAGDRYYTTQCFKNLLQPLRKVELNCTLCNGFCNWSRDVFGLCKVCYIG